MELIHPEYVLYIYEVNNLRMKAAEKIAYRDALVYHIGRDLALDYMLKIGALEYKLLDIKNKVLKNKRILELLEENVPFSDVQKQIKKEFIENDCKVELMCEAVHKAIECSREHVLTEDEIIEINIFYIGLVRDFSPEINLKSSDQERMLFETIREKYVSGNIKELKKFEKFEKQELYFDELEGYKLEKKRLDNLIENIDREIIEIKNQFPFTEKLEIQDENIYRRKKASINSQIEENEELYKELEKKIRKLKKE